MLRTTIGITRMRGVAYEWWGRHLVPTFHPAAALRGSAQVMEDMQFDFSLVAAAVAGSLGGNTDDAEIEVATEPDDDPEQLGLFGP